VFSYKKQVFLMNFFSSGFFYGVCWPMAPVAVDDTAADAQKASSHSPQGP
jgi:hypothetical protein